MSIANYSITLCHDENEQVTTIHYMLFLLRQNC